MVLKLSQFTFRAATIWLFGLWCVVLGFGCQKDKSKHSEGGSDGGAEIQALGDQGGVPNINPESPETSSEADKNPLSPMVVGQQGENQIEQFYFTETYRQEMLSPEQFSKFLEKTFGLARKQAMTNFVTDDWLLINYRIPLGGVDFRNSFERKPDIDAQKILAMRDLAFRYMTSLVQEDQLTLKKKGQPLYFHLADPSQDRPFTENDLKNRKETQEKTRAGEVRWKAQWEDFYRKVFKRDINVEELALIKNCFSEVTALQKGDPSYGWIMTMTAVLMSQEAWTI